MRTTINLPDDLHRQVSSIARDTSRTLSEAVIELMRRGLGQGQVSGVERSERTGLPVIRVGTVVTTDDVRALDDDDPDEHP
jgi:predicted transcriptional regulator